MSEPEPTPEPTPLNVPRCTDVRLIENVEDFERGIADLLSAEGVLGIDAERASGFKYSQRAYLIQMYRTGGPILLVDPIAIVAEDETAFTRASSLLQDLIWIIHAATQDIPCLAELGMRPKHLFDTELAGRILGFERVGLGAMVQQELGLALAKEHSAADWSTRPLPEAWLTYAALDVDVLPELAAALKHKLVEQDKLGWAEQEFEHLTGFNAKPPRADKWRATSGLNTIKDERSFAVVKALWHTREELAKKLDVSPGRLIPDSSIIELATSRPRTKGEMSANKRFAGRASRSYLDTWWQALNAGLKDLNPPEVRVKAEGIPNHRIWANKHPEADARLNALKFAMSELSTMYSMPTENILTPDYMRQLAWHLEMSSVQQIAEFLTSVGARSWQVDLVAEAFSAALNRQPADED